MVCAPWITENDVAACCNNIELNCDLSEMAQAASEILNQLSGQQFPGICEAVVRPCGPYACSCSCGHRGGWIAASCCCPPEIVLEPGPAIAITEIKIDGAVLDEFSYRLDPGSRLVRLRGADNRNEGWPCCQLLDLPSTEKDTFEISYTWGAEPPTIGKHAAAVLACESGKACTDGADCKLPQRVTNLIRQGVSMTILDPQDFLENGKVGLYEVDLFLAAFNPNHLASEPRIYNPDTIHSIRRMS